VTGELVRLPARRMHRAQVKLGLGGGGDRRARLAEIDTELRQINQALATLAARKAAVLREYRREMARLRGR